ncbi:MAG: hypothetical protein JWO66_690 [Candidatus Eremiobacteraeota bacterium]|nr:hypothetical protein [Candidatus Eremiobacteraeota bacterium]
MMFEDTLTYQPGDLITQTFSELLAADLEDDAREFYAGMATDITVVAAGMDRSPRTTATVRTLLMALAATPAARPSFWRQLYREISVLVAGSDGRIAPGTRRAEFVRPLGRLRGFLSENADLADTPGAGERRGTALGRTAEA